MASSKHLQAPYRAATYLLSAHDMSGLPPDEGREVAFVGRSNSGKSSAINALSGQKSLARTSKTPGRTQQLVYFVLDGQRRLVDLPGYGYANVPEKLRRHWRGFIDRYLAVRRSLQGIVLLMDVRHPLVEFDLQMLDWCHHHGVPVHVVLTKSDKLKRGPAQSTLLQVRSRLYDGMTAQLFSARDRSGIDELAQRLAPWYGFADADSRADEAAARMNVRADDDGPKGEWS